MPYDLPTDRVTGGGDPADDMNAANTAINDLHTRVAGLELGDPGADRVRGWDDSEGEEAFLTPVAPVQISGTNLQVADASTSAKGAVELATSAEAIAGSDSSRAVTPAALFAARRQVINAQTGTTYTVVLSDENKQVTLNNASPITVTLPQDSDVAIPIGGRIDFLVIGAGAVTFAAGTGATVNGTPSLVSRAQYSPLSAQKIAANTWVVMGDLTSP